MLELWLPTRTESFCHQAVVGALDKFGNAMTQTDGARSGRHNQASSLRPNNLAAISRASRSLARVLKI
jgi:hypothetical protein